MYRFPDPLDEDALRPLMADKRYGDGAHPEHPFYRKFVDRAFALVYPDPPRDGAGNFVVDPRDPPKPQVITGGAEFKPWEDDDGRDRARASSSSSWKASARSWSAPEAPSSPASLPTANDIERIRQRTTNMRPDLSGPFTGPADARPSPESADSLAYQDAFQRGRPAPVSPLPAPPPPDSDDDELSRQRWRAGLARAVRGPVDALPSSAQADSRAAQELIKGVVENPKPAQPPAPLTVDDIERMRQRATNVRPDLSRPFTGPADARPSPESADSLAYQDAFRRGWPAPVSPLPAPPPPNSVDDELSRQRWRAGLARAVRGPADAPPSGAQADSRAAQDLIKGVVENPKPAPPPAPLAPLVDERVPRSTLAGRELGDIFDDLGRGSALNKDVEELRQLRRDAIANPGDDATRSRFENKKREVAEKFRNQLAVKIAKIGISEAIDYALHGPFKIPIKTAEMIVAVGTKYGAHKAAEYLVDAMVDSALEHAIKQPSRPIRNPDEAARALTESGRFGVYRERESPEQRAYGQIFKGRSK